MEIFVEHLGEVHFVCFSRNMEPVQARDEKIEGYQQNSWLIITHGKIQRKSNTFRGKRTDVSSCSVRYRLRPTASCSDTHFGALERVDTGQVIMLLDAYKPTGPCPTSTQNWSIHINKMQRLPSQQMMIELKSCRTQHRSPRYPTWHSRKPSKGQGKEFESRQKRAFLAKYWKVFISLPFLAWVESEVPC
ncbi:unnamed protein product, partial [Ectocarpus sp. 12 AP-2014]